MQTYLIFQSLLNRNGVLNSTDDYLKTKILSDLAKILSTRFANLSNTTFYCEEDNNLV